MTWTWIAVVVGCVSVLIVGVALLVGRLLHDLGTDHPIVLPAAERREWFQPLGDDDLAQWRAQLDADSKQWHGQLQTDRQRWDDQIRADLDRARKGKPS